MRAGDLDRRIDLRRQLAAQDAAGEPAGAWLTIDRVWAKFTPATGRELVGAQIANADAPATFEIRWRDDIDMTWVIRHDGLVYNVTSITEIGRRDGLRILGVAQKL